MSNWWQDDRRHDRGGVWFGLVLIVLGAVFLAGQVVDINVGDNSWPFFIIVPGVILFVLGLGFGDEAGLGATIPGGMITAVGLLLLYQNTYDAYASWAYAWALVAPGAVGVSLFTYGLLHRRWDLTDAGLRSAAAGLGIFIVLGLILENAIGLEGGASTGVRAALPVLAVAMGVIIVLINLLPRHERPHESPPSGGEDGRPPAA
jgi:hypothetical protein